MSVYYCESCLTNQGTYIDGGDLPTSIPGQPNVGFNIGSGFYDNVNGQLGNINSIQIQSDGKILVGGVFDEYSGTSVGSSLIRLESNGTIDTTFDVGTGFYSDLFGNIGTIYSIQIQSDGKILVGGFFDQYNGTLVGSGLIRLESDGTVDTTFDVGTGFNGNINSIQIQSDGKILVGGRFSEYNGTSVGYSLIRLESDGTIDTTFDVGTGFYNALFSYLGEINSIQIQSDGKILVGGQFDEYSGTSVGSGLIRLESDGTIDTTFDVGSGFDVFANVRSIALQSDGKILVGGIFDEYSGTSVGYNLIRLESDGTIDTTFDVGTGFYSTSDDQIGNIYSIQIQSDGKILVGGYFDEYSGTSVGSSLIRLESDGTIDTTFDVDTGFYDSFNTLTGQIFTIQIQSDGKILVGGYFDEFNGFSSNGICQINSEPITTIIYATDLKCYTPILSVKNNMDPLFSIGTGFSNNVQTIALQSDGKILVGGSFTSYSGVSRNRIVRLNSDYTIDTSFVIGSGFNNTVNTITLQSDGKILVGGIFASYSGASRNRIVRLNTNGSVDTSFVIGFGFNGTVQTIALQSDGKILVGGGFGSYSGVGASRIIRLNTDGSRDTSFVIGTGFSGTLVEVRDIDVQSDGKILAGGRFSSYSGVSINSIIRLNTNGSVDTSFVIGTGFNNTVNTITLQSDGKILVGGDFTSYSGVSINRIIRLNTDGSVDNSFVIGTGFTNRAKRIVLQSDGKILVGGDFTSYDGTSVGYMTRLNPNGSIDNSFVIGTGFNNEVNTIALQPDGKILVGGQFTTLNFESYPRFALILEEPIQGEYDAIELFSECEICYEYVIPKSANTPSIMCFVCSGETTTVNPPRPVWTGLNGGAVTQLNAVLLGGNGLNS